MILQFSYLTFSFYLFHEVVTTIEAVSVLEYRLLCINVFAESIISYYYCARFIKISLSQLKQLNCSKYLQAKTHIKRHNKTLNIGCMYKQITK